MSNQNIEDGTVAHSRTSRWGWRILLILTILLTINGVHLYFFIVETASQQTTAILLTGFGALAVVVALEGFRHGSRWAWVGMWVVVGVLAVVSLHMLRNEQNIIGFWYLALATITLIGQVLARSKRETVK